jgi:predicted ribosome quality control (RQC) complex YloA/Tae2 family protein
LYSSYFVYRIIANWLADKLKGTWLSAAFSTDKDDLILQFSAKNFEFQLHIRFVDGEMFFTAPSSIINQGKNCIGQFKSLVNKQVKDIWHLPFERIFIIQFSSGESLLFKGFGRFGNVLGYTEESTLPETIFRLNLKNDWEYNNQTEGLALEQAYHRFITSGSLKKALSFLPKETLSTIEHNKQDIKDIDSFTSTVYQLDLGLKNPDLYINTVQGIPHLGLSGQSDSGRGIEFLFSYAESYLKAIHFQKQKQQLSADWRNKARHFESIIHENKSRLENLENRRSFKELGDLILSNVHLIKKGVGTAVVQDYYKGGQIRIKLNPDVDAAANAERYYRKAKNENKEADIIANNLKQAEGKYAEAARNIEIIEDARNFSELKSFIKQSHKTVKSVADNKPYREYQFEDYIIWLGKSAAGNDEMLRLAGKNDLWLHAKDVPGSHVIIRKKGTEFPLRVIEFAAKIAARNSKARHQSLVPVTYTERKFVSKAKGSNPGEVRIMKESVLDVGI